jgi:hypothetical protein
MATRAERFKAQAERSKPKRPKADAKRRGDREEPHNFHAGERGKRTYAYEPTDKKKRPPRKSTRISDEHVKTGTELRHRQIMRTTSPSQRARKR